MNLHSLTGGIHQCCIRLDKQCDFCNVCDRSQKSSAALCEGTGGGLPCGSRNSCRRQSSDAVLEPFLEDALPLVPEPVERKIEKKPKQLEKRWKRKLMDSKVKNEKNLECTLSFVEGSETLDNIVLTADVRQTACYIHL